MSKGIEVRRLRETIDLLLSKKLISEEQLALAKEESHRTGLMIDRALEKLNFITNEQIVKVQADAMGVPYMDLTDYIIDAELVKLVPEPIAKKYRAVPLFKIGETLTVGMLNPQDIIALDHFRRVTKVEMIESVLVSEKGIQRILDNYYGVSGSIDELVKSIDENKLSATDNRGVVEAAEEAPIIKLVNLIFSQAITDKASDIHVEPDENDVRIRFRVDGVLREQTLLPKKVQSAVISRIKILSKIDIAETRKAQDGRIRTTIDGKEIDMRVSTFPTIYGENVVIRLLERGAVLLGLEQTGFSKNDLKRFEKLINKPNGIVFVTGPTGSGKTTTLYTALTTINSIKINIKTIEDPVEYELPLIRQTQVNPKAGITFANGLRSILRQDPDVVMVGEIRDKETAEVAIQASLTGHLVFSTLHTNDAATSISRLGDMGIEPFLISSSVIGVIAQRLVRVICEKCKESYSPSAEVKKEFKLPQSAKLFRGKGCNKCNGTGYIGRQAIVEVLEINKTIRDLIDAKKTSSAIKSAAIKNGMTTMFEDGIDKLKKGVTTLEEVLRVTNIE